MAHDLHLRLAHTDGLDQQQVEAGPAEHRSDAGNRLRQASQVTPSRYRPHVHARIFDMALQADPVAQEGPGGNRAGGIDGDHAHRPPFGPDGRDQGGDEGALAHAGRAGDADPGCLTGDRSERLQKVGRRGEVLFHSGDGPSEGLPVAVTDPIHPFAHL